MTDVNTVSLSGALTADAQVKTFQNGGVLNFSVATNRSVKQGDNWVDKASFINCKYWTKGAEKLSQFLKKGTPVTLSGFLEQETWEKDGKKNSRIVINCDNIRWFNRGNGNGNNNSQPQNNYQPQNNGGYQEDIPF